MAKGESVNGGVSAEQAKSWLGQYEILNLIGRGGMGVVYRAHDHTLDRIVALKVLRDDLRRQPALVTRFQREAQATAQLDHPNIVQIFAVGSEGGVPYIAMDYVEGIPLNRILIEERSLEWQRALRIAGQLADALACAHDSHIIHRDIKPGNILVGQSDHVHLTDFGLAKILTEQSQLTIDSARLGTPQYMSPERCRGEEVTAASDLYSLGVVLFQMVSGRSPFEAATPVELVQKILAASPSRLRQFAPDVPGDVERLVAWLIERDPRHRPASAHVAGEALRRVRTGEPLDVGSDMADALAGFRGSESTLTPTEPASKSAGGMLQRTWADLRRFWKNMAPITRAYLTIGIVLVALAGLVWAFTAYNTGSPLPGSTREGVHDLTRWNQSGVVARFEAESPGVFVSRIDLPNFETATLGWMGEGAQAIITLDGCAGTAWAAHSAVCVLDLSAWEGRIRIPPVIGRMSGTAPPLHLLAVAKNVPSQSPLYDRFILRDGNDRGQVLAYSMRHGAGDPVTLFSPRFSPADGIPKRVMAAAVRPDGYGIVLALAGQGGNDAWYLAERDLQEEGSEDPDITLTPPGPPITAVQYAPTGTMIAYVRDHGKRGRELLVVDPAEDQKGPISIAEGDLSFQSDAFSPDGELLAYCDKGREQGGVLRVIRIEDRSVVAESGSALAASWHPSGRYLLTIGRDRKDLCQLWAVSSEAPHRRVQLTYLASGVTEHCTVSTDGLWAMTAEPTGAYQPAVVLVNLSSVEL